MTEAGEMGSIDASFCQEHGSMKVYVMETITREHHEQAQVTQISAGVSLIHQHVKEVHRHRHVPILPTLKQVEKL